MAGICGISPWLEQQLDDASKNAEGEFITNDPDYAPNIRRPRTRALLER